MKEIDSLEHKKILLEILKYIDEVCKKNNINYSLIGGSLIGCVRDNNIIHWDDDIDIILNHEDYVKLKKVLSDKNGRYKYMDKDTEKSYFYPFAKVIDTKTELIEYGCQDIKNYGVYVDVFEFNNTPNGKVEQLIFYNKIIFIKKMLGVKILSKDIVKLEKNIFKRIRNFMIRLLSINFILNKYEKTIHKYNNKNTNFVLYSWPVYGCFNEIQKKENTKEFISKKFGNMDAMIYKNYDVILRNIFGDYMTPPPKEKRVSNHNFKAYWRE